MNHLWNGLDNTNDFDPPAEPKHLCECCKLEPSFAGLDDCAKCFIAYALSEDPEQLHDLSGWSKEDQAVLLKELDRQSQAMLSECYITTKPAVLEDL